METGLATSDVVREVRKAARCQPLLGVRRLSNKVPPPDALKDMDYRASPIWKANGDLRKAAK